ncbi:MAG: hypothetical protein KGP14_00950 [Betaproteobacteria bacterium]|nr:hypothetical protein [Betaproteobacteria bacterium]
MPPEDNATNLPDNDQQGADDGTGVAYPNEHDDGAGDPGDGQPQDGQAQNQDDDSEEVEHEGQKYRIPKALKGALMMNADYTRKTQEVAELRRAAEAERAQYSQANAQQVQAMAQVVAADQQLQQFAQVNWQELSNEDPVRAQQLWMQYSQLKDYRQQVAGQVQQMEQQRAFETQQETAKRIEEGNAVLKRDIPNWGPEVAQQINTFAAKEFGFQPQELAQVTDPRVVKILHAAMVGAQLVKKQQEGTPSSQQQPAVKPVTKVGGNNAPARRDMNSMPVGDWMKARNEQLRKSKGR